MKLLERNISRRSVLAGGAAGALAWLSRPFLKPLRAQENAVAITTVSVAQVPLDLSDPLWDQTTAAPIFLSPQNLVLPRLKEAGAKAISVRALHDADRIGFLLEWHDAHRDSDLGTVLQYRDAVAIQFPEDPSFGTPSFTMGQRGQGVVIYHWKSDWQFGSLYDVDEAYPNMYGGWYQFSGVPAGEIPEATDYLTAGRKEYLTAAAVGNSLADPQVQEKIGPVQKMRAKGFGTIEPDDEQDATGFGEWRDGDWRIVISIPRRQTEFSFEEGAVFPLAFAVWDGSRNERNGQKAYSVWNNMRIGVPKEEGGGVLLPFLGSIGGVISAAIVAILGLRLRRRRRESKK